MADITLQAQERSVRGKKVGALRREGIIPANIYGAGMESLPIQLDVRAFRDALAQAGASTIVDVHVRSATGQDDGKKHPVLIEHIARHPATGKVLHVDLRQVDLNRSVRAAVSIVLTGESPAVKAGGVLMHSLDTVEVSALPRALPHELTVDISTLEEVDSQITVADLKLPSGVTAETALETLVVRIVASKLEQEVAAETAAEAAEAAEAAAEAEEPSAEAAEGGATGAAPGGAGA